MMADWIKRGAAAAALLLAASLAPAAFAEEALTPAQKAAVDREIRDYLAKHPEAVIDAIKAAQAASDAQEAANARAVIAAKHQALFDDPDDLAQGNPKGDATIVEFFDYRCPYCKEIEPRLDALLLEDRKLRIVYKEFPILGAASVFATHAALASKKQGKYAEFHRAMMAARGNISDDTVLAVAASVGLDIAKLKQDMSAPEIDRIIQKNYALAQALHIDGTPGIVVGDTLVPGAVDIATLRKDIASARKGG
jgi:protein-disulfide isomerase